MLIRVQINTRRTRPRRTPQRKHQRLLGSGASPRAGYVIAEVRGATGLRLRFLRALEELCFLVSSQVRRVLTQRRSLQRTSHRETFDGAAQKLPDLLSIAIHSLAASGRNGFLKLPVVGTLTNCRSIVLCAEDDMLGECYLPTLQPCTHQGGRPQCESFCSPLLLSD